MGGPESDQMSVESLEDVTPVAFAEENQLIRLKYNTLPGHPTIGLDDDPLVTDFLTRELSTERLKRLYWMLFLVSMPGNISPLHHQLVEGRKIYLTERPDYHLVWHYGRIFIKPLPKYLLSYRFWTDVLPKNLRPEALGFMHTYSQLIVHESDFDQAKELRLLPHGIDWHGWCHFIQGFRHLQPKDLAPRSRYHYGEIRLTRLNWWHCLLKGYSYAQVDHNYASFFSKFGAPYLFIFGAVTVILTGVQVGIDTFDDEESIYHIIAARVVPGSLILTIIGLLFLPLLFAFFWLKELIFFAVCYRPLR